MTDEQKVWEAFEAWHEMPEHDSGPRDAWEAWKAAWQAALSHASATTGPSRDRASKCPGGMECSTCGCIFIGDESHDECGVCIEQGRDVAFAKATVTIAVGREMFRFNSFQQWVNKAQSWFKRAGVPSSQFVCIDATGRICGMGKQFMSARDRGAFPVIVYDIDPSTALGENGASATAEECSAVPTNSPEIGSKLVDTDAKVTAFRNRFISERTTTWLRDGLDYEMARAKAEADANEYEQAFDQTIAAKRGGQS